MRIKGFHIRREGWERLWRLREHTTVSVQGVAELMNRLVIKSNRTEDQPWLSTWMAVAGKGCGCGAMVGQKDAWMGKCGCEKSLQLLRLFLWGSGNRLAKGEAWFTGREFLLQQTLLCIIVTAGLKHEIQKNSYSNAWSSRSSDCSISDSLILLTNFKFLDKMECRTQCIGCLDLVCSRDVGKLSSGWDLLLQMHDR